RVGRVNEPPRADSAPTVIASRRVTPSQKRRGLPRTRSTGHLRGGGRGPILPDPGRRRKRLPRRDDPSAHRAGGGRNESRVGRAVSLTTWSCLRLAARWEGEAPAEPSYGRLGGASPSQTETPPTTWPRPGGREVGGRSGTGPVSVEGGRL